VCSGLLHPRRGTIELDGVDVTGSTPHDLARRGLCHVPEAGRSSRASPSSTTSNLMSDRSLDDVAGERRCLPCLERKLGQTAGTLSGGEQQMLPWRVPTLTSPSYVLLDEVSMGLAPIVVDEIFVALRRLAETGVALLIVEQYVTKALDLADLVYVLQKGRVAFAGEPAELDADALARSYLGGRHPAGIAIAH